MFLYNRKCHVYTADKVQPIPKSQSTTGNQLKCKFPYKYRSTESIFHCNFIACSVELAFWIGKHDHIGNRHRRKQYVTKIQIPQVNYINYITNESYRKIVARFFLTKLVYQMRNRSLECYVQVDNNNICDLTYTNIHVD